MDSLLFHAYPTLLHSREKTWLHGRDGPPPPPRCLHLKTKWALNSLSLLLLLLLFFHVTQALSTFVFALLGLSQHLIVWYLCIRIECIIRTKSTKTINGYLFINCHQLCFDSSHEGLHWLPVAHRINFKLANKVFKTRIHHQPEYLNNLLVDYKLPRVLRSSADEFLAVYRTRGPALELFSQPGLFL